MHKDMNVDMITVAWTYLGVCTGTGEIPGRWRTTKGPWTTDT